MKGASGLPLRARGLPAACVAALLFCGAAQADAQPQPSPASQPAAPAFSRPSRHEIDSPAVLRAYLRAKDEVQGGRHARRTNRFCFVKQAADAGLTGGSPSVWMIWLEGREVLNRGNGLGGDLPPGEEAEEFGRAEALAKSINLATDVVATPEDIAGSTYLVDRAWADRLTRACRQTGRTLTVAPSRGAGGGTR